MGDKPSEDGTGHRARLRTRLFEGGPDALLDHELVEYLLALAIPRRDTKPLAKALLREFGSIGALLSAEPEALVRQGGLSEGAAASIKIAEAAALRLLASRVVGRPALASWTALIDYLRADMAHRSVERVRVLHLNSKNVLIRDELVHEGTIDQAAVYVREVIRRAMDLGSAALILVHNHPSGDPSPSKQDIQLTRAVIDAGRPLGIAVHDHVIVAGEGHVSLRAQGLI
ncbi:RadC family protein [Sphingomonas jatrophae]|uniref:DNA repair protein RadC n=1 Tax=Sphingomonas jatrophae TaxID=1166337 RepID=A0A1I6JL41_9SPHN|nr:DNA repair protein RadC [Sphingomonas jatrophae]SFR79280.1 DNA repair protein RadC [Sphingomonas jatrophae]